MSINLRPRIFGAKQEAVEATSPLDDLPAEPKTFEDFKDEMPVLGAVDSPVEEAEVYTSVTLRLPQSVYEEYRKVAVAQDQTVEEVMQHRLSACKTHNAVRGLWFSDSERTQLENLVQKWPLENAAQALSILVKSGKINLDGLEIMLTPAQKRVLNIVMSSGGRTPKSFFEAMIKKELRA